MANGKLTLLQVVQKTMEHLGSDEVNSLSDAVEAEQIAQIAEDAYYELLYQGDWDFLQKLDLLESVADADFPNYLHIPDSVSKIHQVKYDFTDPANTEDPLTILNIEYLTPDVFTNKVQRRNQNTDNVQLIVSMNGITLPIFNDTAARWWTSFDDEFVVFDAYINTIDSTLQGNKSQALMKDIPPFTIADTFTPLAPAHFFQLWLNEVIRTAYISLRQEANPTAEQKAARGLAVMRRSASRTNFENGKVRYGRPATAGSSFIRNGDGAIWTNC